MSKFNLSPFSLALSMFAQDKKGLDEPVSRVRGFLDAMEPVHRVYKRQWFLNIANFVGNQWVLWDRIRRRFLTPPSPTWRVRLVINKIQPIARIQIAKLLEKRHRYYVSPSTSDPIDAKGAQLGTKFATNIQDGQEWGKIEDEIAHWSVICGNSYVFPLYDESAGKEMTEPILNPETGEPEVNPENGKPIMRTFNMGDLNLSFENPFNVVADYSVTDFDEMGAVCRQKLRSIDYVKEKFNVDVQPESLSLEFNSAIRAMEQGSAIGAQTDMNPLMRNAVIVNDYYEVPSKNWPKGRHIIMSNNKLLFEGVLTSKYKGKYVLPCVHYGAIKVPGRLMRMAPIEIILPLQWQYNRARSQVIEDLTMMGRPKLLAPLDSLPSGVYTDQPGELLEYDEAAGKPPHYLPAPGPSAAVLEHITRLEAEMNELGGIHEISRGQLPRRATSGFALSILDEKDNTIMGPIKESMRRGHQKTLTMALVIAQEKFIESRQIKIVGPKQAVDLVKFQALDFRGQDDLRVIPDDPFPTSRTAKLEFATNLVKNGLLSAQSARRLMNLSDFANFDEEMMDVEQQRIQAAAQADAEQKRLASEGQDLEDTVRNAVEGAVDDAGQGVPQG